MKRFALAILSMAACDRSLPPDPQIVLFVDTDAIVASAGAPDPTALSPQIDRVRFDLMNTDTLVPGGARVFQVDATMFREHTVSFGVLPLAGAPATSVRVRLYRVDRSSDDEIPMGVAIDRTVDLPPVAGGVVELSAFLAADSFGKPSRATADPGRPGDSKVGTWHGGRRVGCAASPGANEACVPGSAFFFGDPAFRGRTFASDVYEERLVWISPFYLDAHEVTVGELRAGLPTDATKPTAHVDAAFEKDDGYCTWTTTAGSSENLPVNCVPWDTAQAYCHAMGKELPTEAQFELVASGLGDELAFPWGNDDIDCTGAVWGRGGDGIFALQSAACRAGYPTGPALGGSSTRDRVDVTGRGGTGAVLLDLGGNLSEWMLDAWSTADGFWKDVAPTSDPVSLVQTPASPTPLRAARGGSFPYTELLTRAAFRISKDATKKPAEVGFRCARHADPASAP